MEPEALKRTLKHLKDNELNVTTIVTDRHRSVEKILSEDHKDIVHYFDIWHVARSKDSSSVFKTINLKLKPLIKFYYYNSGITCIFSHYSIT